MDELVTDNVIKRTLDCDNLRFVEGKTNKHSEIALAISKDDSNKKRSIHAIDYDDNHAVFKTLNDEDHHSPKGVFEKHNYFDRLFPSMSYQKPGYDLYGSTTLVLVIILVFVLNFYESYNVNPEQFKFFQGKTSLYNTQMAITLVVIVTIIIIERYASRSDTKAKKRG